MPRKLSEKQRSVIDMVAKWKAMPAEMRQNKSLAQLAKANGITPNTDFYHLAKGPEVYHQMLVEVAGKSIDKIPEVLEVLTEHAINGHSRSSEILLNFVRQTITDERLISQIRPQSQIIETLSEVAKVTENLLTLADSLPTEEDAKAFVESMGEGAVEAEWRDSNDKGLSDPVPEVPSLPALAEVAGGNHPPRGASPTNGANHTVHSDYSANHHGQTQQPSQSTTAAEEPAPATVVTPNPE